MATAGAQGLKLQVVPAPVDEALRGRVGLHVKTIKELQVSVGDPVIVRSAQNSEVCIAPNPSPPVNARKFHSDLQKELSIMIYFHIFNTMDQHFATGLR